MKLATKFDDADANIIKINAITVICMLSNFPIISVGLVNIFTMLLESSLKKYQTPLL